MTSRHWLFTVVGLTHASMVIPLVRCNVGASGILTRAFTLFNNSSPPSRPAGVHVALTTPPSFPCPDQSMTRVPVPSSKEYAAARPVVIGPPTVQLAREAAVVRSYGLSATVTIGTTDTAVMAAVVVAGPMSA